jgi:hypothetical protein
MRDHYRNGDEISLRECGCDGCSPAVINGVLCHEAGCPESWRDYTKECCECGCEFYADVRWQSICDDCANAPAPDCYGESEECFECGEPWCRCECEDEEEDS